MLNLVFLRQGVCVEVVDLGDACQSDKPDDDIDGLIDGAEVDEAPDLGHESGKYLHGRHEVGSARIGELKGLV